MCEDLAHVLVGVAQKLDFVAVGRGPGEVDQSFAAARDERVGGAGFPGYVEEGGPLFDFYGTRVFHFYVDICHRENLLALILANLPISSQRERTTERGTACGGRNCRLLLPALGGRGTAGFRSRCSGTPRR